MSALEKMRMGRNFARNVCVAVVLLTAIAVAYVAISRRNNQGDEDPTKLLANPTSSGLLLRQTPRQDAAVRTPFEKNKADTAESEDNHDGEVTLLLAKSSDQKSRDDDNKLTGGPDDIASDARSPECRDRKYDATKAEVALIIDYDGKSSASRMADNIIRLVRYGGKLITEVVLVVRGSVPDEQKLVVIQKAWPDMRTMKVSNDEIADARMVVARKVKAGVIVFADAFAIFANNGWLEPLVAALIKHPSSIIVPHFDELKVTSDGKTQYQVTSDRLVADYAWPMKIQMTENVKARTEDGGYLRSSALRGNIFIVRKAVFIQMGEYDQFLTDAASAHLELSLRIWMCGGSVLIAPCSRVGVSGLFETLRVPSRKKVLLIADMWFGSKREVLLKTTGLSSAVVSKSKRIKELGLKCKTIEWYLSDVATNSPVPSTRASHFGRLASRADLCARLATTDSRVEMGSCDQTAIAIGGPMYFELTTSNRLITTTGQCLSAQVSAYIVPTACNPKDDQQHWEYFKNGQLINVWSHYCAMHVTDPDRKTNAGRQVVMAQNCTVDQANGKVLEEEGLKFSQWDFKTAS